MRIKLPESVQLIIRKITDSGYEAYAVGGCVRDSLRGNSPNDWDICTSALPENIEDIFSGFHIIETGLQHGTVTIMIDHIGYEITTYRIEGKYSDRRKPDYVSFVTDLREDVKRRDFTINSMAYNDIDGLKDYFGGEDDLKKGIIRCVGNADERFNEDALRILRAMRFASSFDFKIENDTSKAMHKNKELLNFISKERISAELLKLICGKGAARILDEFRDILAIVIPELKPEFGFEQNNPYHDSDVWQHTLRTVDNIRNDEILRLSMLFHDCGKPHCYTEDQNGGHFYGHAKISAELAENALKRLKMSNDIIKSVKTLVLYHDVLPVLKRKGLLRLLNKIGMDNVELLFEIVRADAKGHAEQACKNTLKLLESVNTELAKIQEENKCFQISDLNISGKDIIALGINPGKQIGEILKKLMNMVMDDEISNDHEILIKKAAECIQYDHPAAQ